MTIYVVQAGDSVDSIAAAHNTSTNSIIYNNQLSYPYRLAIGQALLLTISDSTEDRMSIVTGGYAYPFINEAVLRETLPYLTALYVFSYGFT